MKFKAFIKGLIMAIVAFFATVLTTTGFPKTKIGWSILAITLLGTVLLYIGKNWLFPSTSKIGTLNARDWWSGLFMALSIAISNYAATLITQTSIEWVSLVEMMGVQAAGYYLKNLTSNAPKEPTT